MYRYFATVARGLEEVAAQELLSLGAIAVEPDFTGVHFQGNQRLLYRVNLWARTVFRVLMPIREFPCKSAQQLYKEVKNIDWRDYLTPEQTLAVDCTGGNQKLNHSHYSALQVKNAIVDQQSKKMGIRSDVDVEYPDVRINLHIRHDQGIISLDSSGESLHRRGYRPAMGRAPLKESLAAALLDLAQWNPSLPFLDPLCGSGTLPIEAGLKALNIAPGLFRERFGVETWRGFDALLWQELLLEAKSCQLTSLPNFIGGRDRDSQVIAQAKTNAENCGLASHLSLVCDQLANLAPPTDSGILICNPPYGKRIGKEEELGTLYKLLGDIFKQRFAGWTAYILTGSKELSKCVGLKTSQRIPVYNGTIPCTLLKYELY
jgi:putative N6-adenine-specific DNA methylase